MNLVNFFNNITGILKEEKGNVFKDIKNYPDISRYLSRTGFSPLNLQEPVPKDYVKKEVQDPENTKRGNVIYLTTKCNLQCTYCYEKERRNKLEEQATCTQEIIDSFINEIYKREKHNSCIVVMGGEPILRMDLFEYLVDKVCEKTKPGGWAIDLITNGTLLSDKYIQKLLEIRSKLNKLHNSFSLEISYDGSGHFKRKFPDGTSSKECVENTLARLDKAGLKYCISYTCHTGNYKNLLYDVIFILEKFKPTALAIGFDYEDLDSVVGQGNSFKMSTIFRPYGKLLYQQYGVPICGIVCGICKRCDRANIVGLTYCSPTEGIIYTPSHSKKKFENF